MFALGRNVQACMSQNEKRRYNKRAFEKQMQDPMALLTSLAAKSHAERVDKASGGSNSQPQAPSNARADCRGQPSHGLPAMQNPAAQFQLQTQRCCRCHLKPSGNHTLNRPRWCNNLLVSLCIHGNCRAYKILCQEDKSFIMLVNIFNQQCNNLGPDMLIYHKLWCRAILEKDHRFNSSNLDLAFTQWWYWWLHRVNSLDRSKGNYLLRLIKAR
jgi:hypothetical protein